MSRTWAAPCVWAPIPAACSAARRVAEIYGVPEVSERHRHRYEVVERVSRPVRRARPAPERSLARWLARRDRRAGAPSLVRRSASSIPSCSRAPRVRTRCSRASSRRQPVASGAAPPRPPSGRSSKRPTDHARRRSRATQLFLIAGPCVLEDDALNLRVAEQLARLAPLVPGGVIFKASFDKANRVNAGAPPRARARRGARRARHAFAPRPASRCSPTCICRSSAPPAVRVVDVLQIPAFLCRQTDLLEAAGATGRPVNIKKGQWMHPGGHARRGEKVLGARAHAAGRSAGAPTRPPRVSLLPVAVTERGTFFGYGDLVVDMRSFSRLRAGHRRARDLRRHALRAAAGAGAGRRQRRRRASSFRRSPRGRRRRRGRRLSGRRTPTPITRRATARTCCR